MRGSSPSHLRLSLLSLVIGMAVGCAPAASGSPTGTEPGSPTGTPGDNPGPVSPEAAGSVIRAVRLDDRESLAALERIRLTKDGAAAAAALLATHPTGDALWAATYVYASSGGDAAPLRDLVNDADTSVRVMAAAGLVARGDPAGFEPLVHALTDRELLVGSEPPQEVWTFVTTTLVRYAGPQGPVASPDAGPDVLAANQEAWQTWLQANGDGLRFDAARGTWSVS